MSKVRVLVVDDSAFMRYTISHHLSSQADMEVVGLASDGIEGVEQVEALRPDVVTLDVEMPRLDGLSALRQIMAKHPLPVVMMSSLTKEGAAVTVEALTLGAVDFVNKPSQSISVHQVLGELAEKVRQAARAHVRAPRQSQSPRRRAPAGPAGGPPDRIVVIGSSTGGPGALREVIGRLPVDLGAGVVVVQHMPPSFTRSLAERLDQLSAVPVKEAEAGDRVQTGQVLIAPGGLHMTLTRGGEVQLNDGPAVNGVKPAVDVTMVSVAAAFADRVLGVVLTGMGHDGRDGARAIKQAGGRIITQDEATCIVYGMPRSVAEAGLADMVLPIDQIADGITQALSQGTPKTRFMRQTV
ncbi:MAG: protein-glutamate methylesterase/protein-glutamine glutaminase [Anaerolineae bacterium]